MESMAEAKGTLENHGMKVTWQRLLIVSYLLRHQGHFSAEEISTGFQDEGQSLSLATVYNNLNAMVDAGLLTGLDTELPERRYDIVTEPHAHRICRCCGQIEDMPFPYDISPAGQEMAASGFDCRSVQMTFYGICTACKGGVSSDSERHRVNTARNARERAHVSAEGSKRKRRNDRQLNEKH